MKKVLTYSAIFIVCYVGFVVATIPAHILLDKVTLPKTIDVKGVAGTIWQPSVEQIETKQITVNKIEADLSVLSLLSMTPRIDATFGDAMLPGPEGSLSIESDGENFSIEHADVLLAASEITQQLNLGSSVVAKGTLNLNVEKFTSGKPMCGELTGKVTWPKARVEAFDEKINLKDLSATLSCDKGAIVLSIDENNDLGLSFNAYMRRPGKLTGDGFITPGDKFPEELRPMLSFLGKADPEGRYRLRL